ncbi:type IV pilus secretin PilQ [Phytohalomonas tamaricis]|uniref:type IV pilus secretin PilQ n=1 Tax=Phytohalomonas tamaricis TaxID=2081032 RepID=UPI000D0BAD7D|nr:type IV pilus secretin PilQ [Phytohalomonas tamaricis]
MKALYRRLFMVTLVVIAWNTLSIAAAEAAPALTTVSVDAARADQVTFGLRFDGPAPEPKSYMLSSPRRLVLDFAQATSRLTQRRYPVGRNGIDELNVMGDDARLRLVISLLEPQAYTTRRDGNMLYVQVGATASAGSASFMERMKGSERSETVAPDSAGARVELLDFRTGANGAGRLVVTLSRANIAPDIETVRGGINVVLPGVTLPQQWRQILDVSDFATPVQRVTPSESADGVRLMLATQNAGAPLVTQVERELTIEVPPLNSPQAAAQQSQFPYSGKKITLNFQNIEVRTVLSILAEEGGLNLVVSDNVSGGVTLNLQNVPWDQALELVLRTRGLASLRTGNVLLVAPSGELAAMAQQAVQADQSLEQTAQLTTDYIQVRYAKAADMATLLRGDAGLGLLSERGRVMVDARTNTLLIQDTREQIEQVRRTLDHLDVPIRQVQIEARIVIARQSVTNTMGIRWGASKASVPGSGINLSGASTGVSSTGGLVVDLGSDTSPTTTFSFGYLSGDVLLDLELNALESEGKSQTISQPKVITANQQKAVIKQGQEIPYQESTSSGATNVEFKEAVLSLQVTPQITPDNRIIMDLIVNNDDVSSTDYDGAPAIDTNEIQTQVLVNNGETVVLGGILSTEQLRNLYKTPFLGDLPMLGQLFRYTEESNEKVELLVFITPKIIEDGLAVR